MSIQSMKYHNLPTAKQIDAYNSGRMSVGERKWMDSMIKRNSFVKESVEAAKTVDMVAVARISSHVSTHVTASYWTKVGFWTKYGGWINFGSVLVLLGLGAFFGPDLYNELTTSETIEITENSADETPMIKEEVPIVGEELVGDREPLIEKTTTDRIVSSTSNNVVSEESVNSSIESDSQLESLVNDNKIDVVEVIPVTTPVEKTVDEKQDKEVSLTVIAPKKVSILSKFDPDGKLTSGFPTYPRGDGAMCTYFKDKLRAIQIPDAGSYEKKATITLTVNSKGKVVRSNLKGNIHPTHEAALQTAISNLPKFNSGKSDVQYAVVVAF